MILDVLRFTGGICIAAGVFFSFAAVVAILRFPDVFTRLHGSSKALSGGAILILLGALPYTGTVSGAMKLVLIAAFFLVSNPMASYAIARAARKRGKEENGQ